MSSSNNIIVQEYLSSLKEDNELDSLFPILLNVMGFHIIQTAKEAKGQSQYGKDIIAIGKDKNGIKHKWYFELKGYKDRDITDKNFTIPDGVLESIREAKFAAFDDSSIPEFNHLPLKIVVVHNGILKPNIRPTFEGFISKEFKPGEFERWDIYYLTDLFSRYLFSEYLLSDSESNRLFKRTLAFLDAADNDFADLKQLIEIQFDKVSSIKGRAFKKLFATLNLVTSIIFHYSKENDNLIAAKECSDYIVLRTWAWILKSKFEKKQSVLNEFRKLLKTQYQILNSYFLKTFSIATIEDGLYAENGDNFEAIGYPLRCFEYISDLIYYCNLRLYLPNFKKKSNAYTKIHNRQKDKIITLIKNNPGFFRPLLDNHSIPILQLFMFFIDKSTWRQKDVDFIASYVFGVITGLIVIKKQRGRFPEGYNRINLLVEYVSTNSKPQEYIDDSSILIAVLFELLVIFNAKDMYENLKKHIGENMHLQIAHPNVKDFDIEQIMFERHMDEEYYIEGPFSLVNTFEDLKEKTKTRGFDKINYRTDNAGFSFLRILAHKYFKNEIFPNEWRGIISEMT
ncbi:hypothetical protein [Maribellus maritimus]|uniref:hypothetical protein n=1 Tax=Maribellus maritimus TaxID=2870838 RepID=UPI001EEB933C|nr:hypothetical protein [Maribellus maritimus]MCG6191347.1 hypothetical protein [Maribellus maritimus]